MRKWIVLEHQEGGCDYTIGCGICWTIIEAEDRTAVLAKVFGTPQALDKYESEDAIDDARWDATECMIGRMADDGCPDAVEIHEIGGACISEVECAQYYGEMVYARESRKHNMVIAENEDRDKQEYERLKEKYG